MYNSLIGILIIYLSNVVLGAHPDSLVPSDFVAMISIVIGAYVFSKGIYEVWMRG